MKSIKVEKIEIGGYRVRKVGKPSLCFDVTDPRKAQSMAEFCWTAEELLMLPSPLTNRPVLKRSLLTGNGNGNGNNGHSRRKSVAVKPVKLAAKRSNRLYSVVTEVKPGTFIVTRGGSEITVSAKSKRDASRRAKKVWADQELLCRV